MLNISITSDATFGHASRADAPAITDALSNFIEEASREVPVESTTGERTPVLKDAESFLGRAYSRLIALGRASQPFIGQRYTVDFVEAANAADLLIASDILMALLLDGSLRRSEKLAYVLGFFLPDAYPRPEQEVEFTVNTTLDGAGALIALHDEEQSVPLQPLAAWYDDVLRGSYFSATHSEGFLAEVALVREQFFMTYLDRDCDVPEDRELSKVLLITILQAIQFGDLLAERASGRRRKAMA